VVRKRELNISYLLKYQRGNRVKLREIRKLNFLYLADKVYGRQALADLLGYDNTGYLNLLAKGHSNIGDEVAEKIEAAAGKSPGWMDTPHPTYWGRDSMEALKFTEDFLKNLAAADLAKLVDLTLKEIATRKE
jgi:hypothetical protein